MACRIEGQAAELRWGYYVAATLGAWTLQDQALTATITQADTFRLAQRPLAFVVGSRRWPVEILEVSDHRVSGRVQVGG